MGSEVDDEEGKSSQDIDVEKWSYQSLKLKLKIKGQIATVMKMVWMTDLCK